MAKRTRNGMVDPYATRRPGSQYRKPYRRIDVPLADRKAVKTGRDVVRALDQINREAREKESALTNGLGSSSGPQERHYPKEFKIKKPEDGE